MGSFLVASCASDPPEVVTLEVGAIVDSEAPSGAHRITLQRGQITEVNAVSGAHDGRLEPGEIRVWNAPGLPSPDTLIELLQRGVTGLVVVDRPLADSLALREYVGTGRNRGPRLYVSGPELSSAYPGVSRLHFRTAVQDAIAVGVDFVVVSADADEETVCTVIAEAKRQRGRSWLWREGGGQRGNARRGGETHRSESAQPRLLKADCSPDVVWPAATEQSDVVSALNLDDVLGRVAPGYRADLCRTTHHGLTVYIDGVRQRPAAPWLASLRIAFARYRIENRLEQLTR